MFSEKFAENPGQLIFAGWAESPTIVLACFSTLKTEVFTACLWNLCQLAGNLRGFPGVLCGGHLMFQGPGEDA